MTKRQKLLFASYTVELKAIKGKTKDDKTVKSNTPSKKVSRPAKRNKPKEN